MVSLSDHRFAWHRECRGAEPHCRGRGGVPRKRSGWVGGKNYLMSNAVTQGPCKGRGYPEDGVVKGCHPSEAGGSLAERHAHD